MFSESQSRIIVSVSELDQTKFEDEIKSSKVNSKKLGIVTGNDMFLKNLFNVSIKELSEIYYDTIPGIMSGEE